jgi:transcriptional regulator with XRE-family HTH domain
MKDNELGEFLRAQRAGVRPDQVGMPSHGVRRVAGLRREEVAVLAGMNVDYYTRLEQGRERRPSPQLVDALSRALLLDGDARAHLHRLAGTAPSRGAAGATGRVDPALRVLLDGYTHTPALVIDPTLDILAANSLAQAVYAPFEPMDNLARMVFLDPLGRTFHPRWEENAEAVVGHLRQTSGVDPGSPRLADLVAELSSRSPDFTRLWESHHVRGKTRGDKCFRHPDVGELSLTYHAFDVRDVPGQQLVIYHAEPGSPSAQALGLLGSVHATARQG